jgi:hypothetical protein
MGTSPDIGKSTNSEGKAKGGYLEIDNDFTLNGLLDINDGEVYVHGIFGTAATASVVIDGGTFVADAPLAKGWEYLNGNLSMYSGLFEITYNSPHFSSSATSTISGGIVRSGEAFYARAAGNFEPTGGVVEIVGTGNNTVYCDAGNYFYDLLINRDPTAVSSTLTDVTVKNDLTINSGTLDSYGNDLYIGGNWTNNEGSSGFAEQMGTVVFNGSESRHILTGETFYNLTLDKTTLADWLTLSDDVTVLGDFVLDGGSFHTEANVIDVNGNVDVNVGVFFVQPGGTLKVGDDKNLTSALGSHFYIEGNSSNYATLTHSGSGRFGCDIYGEIAANYAVFDYTNYHGVYLHQGATVNPTYTFNHCIFQNGAPAKGSAYLILDGSNTFTAIDTYFDVAGGDVGNNVWKYYDTGNATFKAATGDFAGPEYEFDPNNRIHWTDMDVELDLTVMLEGPYNGVDMNTDLRDEGVLPLSQPFNTFPYNYTGSESVASIPANVVDWVLIELRDADSPANADAASTFEKQAAFVLNDGSIVDIDGSSPLTYTTTYNKKMYPVILQLNHLAVVSGINLQRDASGVYEFDFTNGGAYGGAAAQKQVSAGVWAMFGGDGSGNGSITSGDINNWKSNAGEKGYFYCDYNLDSQMDNKDKNDICVPNIGESSQVNQPMKSSSENNTRFIKK